MKSNDIKKWIDGTLTEEEQRGFENSDVFKSLERLSKSTMAFKAPEYDAQLELERLSKRKPSGKVISLTWTRSFLRIAAALALLIACTYLIFYSSSPSALFETQAGMKKDFILPDASFVSLNASSSLSYSMEMNDRRVDLNGEAYFKVKKGSSFEVKTSVGTVTVLGTQFNVKSRDDFFEVICYEGLVRVEGGGKIVNLQPHQVFRSIKGAPVLEFTVQDADPSWIHNESSFRSVPFDAVIRELQIQYNVSVATKDVDTNQLFTGRFPHNDLQLALQSISLPLNLSFQFLNKNHILLSSEFE
jgi:ferric-dicitrate binding protein FerR (iron transport regulator)